MKRWRLSFAFLFVSLTFLLAQSPTEVEITAEPHHHLVLINDHVRVFSVEVAPHGETMMHWHRHDYIYVTLGASVLVNAVKGKEPITLKLEDGETRFTAGNFAHIARNTSDQTFRNVTIELLQDDKAPTASDKGASRGLEILQGGTKEILFVKDAVRASEVELQPRGVVPLSRGPVLLVAVSDVDLQQRDDPHGAAAKAGMQISQKSGGVQWLPASHVRSLKNGSHPAKFIMLEFPPE